MARDLDNPWQRTCPDCGNTFSAVQEKGVCLNCSLWFAVARDGRFLYSYARSESDLAFVENSQASKLAPIVFPDAQRRLRRRRRFRNWADAKQACVRWWLNRFRSRPRMSAEQVVEFYQDLGFLRFGAVETVLRRYQKEMGGSRASSDPNRPWDDDAFLLSFDETRVWAGDPEADVGHGEQVYCEVLAEWSRISCGTFMPSEIEEHWESDRGPLVVSFSMQGKRYGLDPEWHDRWMDLTILAQINTLIAATGKQFVCAGADVAVIFVCDDDTRQKLKEVRRFPFCTIAPCGP